MADLEAQDGIAPARGVALGLLCGLLSLALLATAIRAGAVGAVLPDPATAFSSWTALPQSSATPPRGTPR